MEQAVAIVMARESAGADGCSGKPLSALYSIAGMMGEPGMIDNHAGNNPGKPTRLEKKGMHFIKSAEMPDMMVEEDLYEDRVRLFAEAILGMQ
jgi:hypothetical protein